MPGAGVPFAPLPLHATELTALIGYNVLVDSDLGRPGVGAESSEVCPGHIFTNWYNSTFLPSEWCNGSCGKISLPFGTRDAVFCEA